MTPRRPAGGFTLVEVLAALLVLSVVLVVVTRALVKARLAADGASTRADAARLAAELIESPLGSNITGPGSFTGQRYGFRWRMEFAALEPPLPDGKAAAPPAFVPLHLRVTVLAATGPVASADSIRLVARAP